jgi:plastocyanin
MKKRHLLLAIALAALALTTAACGGESLPSTEEPVVVTAVDYGFDGLPEKVKVGTTLALENDSMVEIHELVAIRLPDDEDRTIDDLVQLPPDELAAFFPGVATVVIAPPGESGIAVEGAGVLSEPGRYAVICAIPTGADPNEYLTAAAEAEGGPPEVAGGPPHLAMGMYGEVTVVE